jgi:ABC-type Fe3+-siderophore transport system permease subunit
MEQQQPFVVLSTFFTQHRMTLSLVAAGLVFVGYLLPWVSFNFMLLPNVTAETIAEVSSISGLSIIKAFAKTLDVQKEYGTSTNPIWNLLYFAFLFATPISALLFFLGRYNDTNFKNKNVAVISTAITTFIPLFFSYTYCFSSEVIDFAKQSLPYGLRNDSIINIGIGGLMMMIGAIY